MKSINKSHLIYYTALAVPFVIVIIILNGLKDQFPAFHGSDEFIYHFPVILKFARDFPYLDLRYYDSATTPLFHILFMLVGKIIGLELFKLRLMNCIISFIAIIFLFRLFFTQVQHSILKSFIFSLLFLLSPYFFPGCFILLTDNLGILFCIISLIFIYKFYQTQSLNSLAIGALFMCGAELTRQSYIWLSMIDFFLLAVLRIEAKRRIIGILIVLISVIPLFLFFMFWHALTPPAFQEHHLSNMIVSTKPFVFMISLIGLYSIFLDNQFFISLFKLKFRELISYLITIFIGFLFLFVFPVSYNYGDDGFLWRISSKLPTILNNTGILFWFLFPLGLLEIHSTIVTNSKNKLPFLLLLTSILVLINSKLLY
jgi:hypothetical protein